MVQLKICSWSLLITAVLLVGCRDDDPHICEEKCEEMADCAALLGKLESQSACERDCFDDLERYEGVHCEDEFIRLKECERDLSCTSYQDVGDKCAYELDNLARCIE